MDEPHERHARSFGPVADAYDRGRPGYPDAAVSWLVGDTPVRVLELGAGTGKLTTALVAAGHEVHATDPDPAMLEHLRRRLSDASGLPPGLSVSVSGAEDVPLDDGSVDVVVAAQCAHWFDPEPAMAEVARVLRPGGVLAAVWNIRDERIPWVRKLGRIIGTQDRNLAAVDGFTASGWFDDVESEGFSHWQRVDRHSIQDLVRSRSNIAVMTEAERERVLADLLALYDDYGRGMDGMQLPYRTECFRSVVARHPEPEPEPVAPEPEPTVPLSLAEADQSYLSDLPTLSAPDPLTDSAATLPRVITGLDDDAGLLLIELR